MRTNISLITPHNIVDLPPPGEGGRAGARTFLLELMLRGTTPFIENLDSEIFALLVEGNLLPLTVNEAEFDNSYVCSPYGQYVLCAKEQISHLQPPFLRPLCSGVVKGLDPCCKRGEMNKIVWVNHWLLATSLYPSLTPEQLVDITLFLAEVFPDHAIGFRSLHEEMPLFSPPSLREEGYALIPSRTVYLLDTLSPKAFRSRMFRSDTKVLEKSDYSVVSHEEITEEDIPRIVSLYHSLYIDKYSSQSPQLTEAFVELALKTRVLEFKGLKKGGSLDAITGFVAKGDWMTSPLFGYDRKVPQEEGLYRMLSTLVTLEAKERGLRLNQSAGAGSYKMLRRAKPVMEWMAIYTAHLPWYRQLPWKTLQWVMGSIGLPLMWRLEKG